MQYFIDTEYDFSAAECRITPISIGVVAEDGRTFYAVSTEFKAQRLSPWVRDNVLPLLPERRPSFYDSPRIRMTASAWMSRGEIAKQMLAFVGDDPAPEFWGDYADFDYVVLSILMGGFDAWPKTWPMFINDLQQHPFGLKASDAVRSSIPHDALSDARAVHDAYRLAMGDPVEAVS